MLRLKCDTWDVARSLFCAALKALLNLILLARNQRPICQPCGPNMKNETAYSAPPGRGYIYMLPIHGCIGKYVRGWTPYYENYLP